MRINLNEIAERTMPGMNGGTGEMTAKLYSGEREKIIPCRIHPGGSIGLHSHPTSDEIDDILAGTGRAICDGEAEELAAGVCHLCKKGSEHAISNTGSEDLVLLTVVVER